MRRLKCCSRDLMAESSDCFRKFQINTVRATVRVLTRT
jgi:hypothetical protein